MIVSVLGRASAEGLEEIQPVFETWVREALKSSAPNAQYLIIFRGYTQYGAVMPSVRIFESRIMPTDIIIEVFPRGSAEGLCFILYTPEGVERSEVARILRDHAPSFTP